MKLNDIWIWLIHITHTYNHFDQIHLVVKVWYYDWVCYRKLNPIGDNQDPDVKWLVVKLNIDLNMTNFDWNLAHLLQIHVSMKKGEQGETIIIK